ncbi:MAG: hypothetical protein P1P88_22795, partial [Bacteroidales bacterium]|nr:hypothetical protein [Bacteroidales bacterium]
MSHNFFSQEIDTIETHSKENQKVKKGFNLGAIPIFSFDSDVGLKYGALANLYHYGDGSRYPTYNHSLFVRWYQTTRGSSISELKYDSDKLLRGLRLTLGAFYQTEKALNFYGFNGYESYYNKNFEEKDHPEYISAVFYRHERKVVRINADFQGKISKNLRWLGGFSFLNSKIAKVDIDKLNKGRGEDDLIPKVDGIYDLYLNWKVLPESEINGGENSFLKAGLVYNSTDNEANPSSGIWTEALVFFAPESFGFEATTSIISLIHRQYITLFHEHFKVAYRIGYQTKISGKMPFYLLPYLTDSRNTADAFGGAKTLRGILRNRIVGNGSAFGNIELRYKIFQATL